MKTVTQKIKELRQQDSVIINQTPYLNYTVFMWYLGRSTHIHQLVKKQDKYPAHFVEVNGKPYVTVRYATYILEHEALQAKASQIEGGVL